MTGAQRREKWLKFYPQLKEAIDEAKSKDIGRGTAILKGIKVIDLLEDEGLLLDGDYAVEQFMLILKDVLPTDKEADTLAQTAKRRQEDDEDLDSGRAYRVNKRRVRECDMPWCVPEDEDTCQSKRETRHLIAYFSRDIQTVKRWVQSAPGCPTNFLPTE